MSTRHGYLAHVVTSPWCDCGACCDGCGHETNCAVNFLPDTDEGHDDPWQ